MRDRQTLLAGFAICRKKEQFHDDADFTTNIFKNLNSAHSLLKNDAV